MGLNGAVIWDQQAVHFITFATVPLINIFTRSEYVNIGIKSLRYCQKEKGLIVYAYCKKSNDLQFIISAINNNLCDTIGNF